MNQDNKAEGKAPRKKFTEDFRRSVVDHWLANGKTASQISKEFGVNIWNLRDWKRRYGPSAAPLDGAVPKTAEELARENQQLRRELARVTMQRDILKKTMGILSET
jgi:transposase